LQLRDLLQGHAGGPKVFKEGRDLAAGVGAADDRDRPGMLVRDGMSS